MCVWSCSYTHTQIWYQETYDSIKGQTRVHKKMFLVAHHLNDSSVWLERSNPKVLIYLMLTDWWLEQRSKEEAKILSYMKTNNFFLRQQSRA